jgi:glutathione peroxidase-family protein
MTTFHDISMASITGDSVDFSDYQGQLCLLVNVASQ